MEKNLCSQSKYNKSIIFLEVALDVLEKAALMSVLLNSFSVCNGERIKYSRICHNKFSPTKYEISMSGTISMFLMDWTPIIMPSLEKIKMQQSA